MYLTTGVLEFRANFLFRRHQLRLVPLLLRASLVHVQQQLHLLHVIQRALKLSLQILDRVLIRSSQAFQLFHLHLKLSRDGLELDQLFLERSLGLGFDWSARGKRRVGTVFRSGRVVAGDIIGIGFYLDKK